PCHRVFVSPISAGTQPPRCTLCARGHNDVAVVVMRENGQPWLKDVENVHRLYGLCMVSTNLATELRLLFTMTAIVP
ncbi:hypothetical protein, partial [Phytobacter diazotrophicus]|uniref:hypothetical protein n=1 Tax=Phytobacter diazotrophicus TaxID=395631 RepID=UPI002FFA1961